ncbi:MAG: HDOD domain-containing protein [Sedimenticola sp.]|nr:HDOD domain-containing protein [Sedimenticola sp.]
MIEAGEGELHHGEAIRHKIATLPLLPSVVSRLLLLNPDDDNFLDEVHHLARQDPTFSFRLIQYAARTCRSSAMADKFSLRHAIARLGSRQIASIVASLSLTDAFEPQNESDRNLWLHSVEVAVAARKLVEAMPDLQLDAELIYLGALLHDIGRFVIFQAIPEGPARIDEHQWITPLALLEAESAICGTDHVTVGRQACEHWEIPAPIRDIVDNHHNYDLPVETVAERLLCTRVGVIQIADFYSVYLMNHAAGEPVEGESEEALAEREREALSHALEPILAGNGSVLPVKYRSLVARILQQQGDAIMAESKRILDALGITE